MGASAVVGTTIPHAVGYAYALKLQKKPSVVVSFFGDGASDEGVFHESLNFAALKSSRSSSSARTTTTRSTRTSGPAARPDICGRAHAHGMPAERIEDNDVLEINRARGRRRSRQLRRGKSGPCFFECMTYRWKEHVGPGEDYDLGYRIQKRSRALDRRRPGSGVSARSSTRDAAGHRAARSRTRSRGVRLRGGQPVSSPRRTLYRHV